MLPLLAFLHFEDITASWNIFQTIFIFSKLFCRCRLHHLEVEGYEIQTYPTCAAFRLVIRFQILPWDEWGWLSGSYHCGCGIHWRWRDSRRNTTVNHKTTHFYHFSHFWTALCFFITNNINESLGKSHFVLLTFRLLSFLNLILLFFVYAAFIYIRS